MFSFIGLYSNSDRQNVILSSFWALVLLALDIRNNIGIPTIKRKFLLICPTSIIIMIVSVTPDSLIKLSQHELYNISI